MAEVTEVIDAEMVQAVAQFPPRADAIITLLASDDFLPGAQTLLYSIQKTLDKTVLYPPELVVLTTPDVSDETKQALWPAFCTRILDVPIIDMPTNSINRNIVTEGEMKAWDHHCPGLTKLHIFGMNVYDVILFVESDCLVLKNVYPLIKRGKVYTETEALVAAAPDMFPPDKFNSGVMVVRPNPHVFDKMMQQRTLLTNYDNSDTGWLNAFYPEWHTEMAPLARLPFGYNAQRALYDITTPNHKNYWDVAVAPDLHILHYSGTAKPWDAKKPPPSSNNKTGDDLTDLWRQWYQRSKNFAARFKKEKEKEAADRAKQQAAAQANKPAHKRGPQGGGQQDNSHKVVSKRYKEFRSYGYSPRDAMAMARAELGADNKDDTPSEVGAKVGAMFGLGSIL